MSEAQTTTDLLATTRESLHRVAEHVLSAARKRSTGQISLRPGPGGVRTPPIDPDGRVLALVGAEVAVIDADGSERFAPLTTVREVAAFAGVEPGFPWTKHPPGTPFTPDEPLEVDAHAAGVLAGWYALADRSLAAFAAEVAPGEDLPAQVFPEHFDVAITVDRVNYGASPGDQAIPAPYLYIGPFDGPPGRDDFWNAPFGAYRSMADVVSPEDALAFFRSGRERLAARPQHEEHA